MRPTRWSFVLAASVLGVVGLGVLAAVSRLVETLLFGVSGTDPLVFAAVSTGLLIVAAVASYVPARRAVRIDPVDALRQA